MDGIAYICHRKKLLKRTQTMKRLITAMALVLATGLGTVQAQENFRWGVNLGLNVSQLSPSGFDNRVGFHAGVKTEIALPQLSNGVYLDLGAMLTLKGAKADIGNETLKLNPCYLEIPIHMGYKYQANDHFAVFANAGPYFGIGLFGKAKYDGESEAVFDDHLLDKRFDFGLGLKGGIEFNKQIQISIGYDWGLVECANDCKNRNLMISLGVLI